MKIMDKKEFKVKFKDTYFILRELGWPCAPHLPSPIPPSHHPSHIPPSHLPSPIPYTPYSDSHIPYPISYNPSTISHTLYPISHLSSPLLPSPLIPFTEGILREDTGTVDWRH